MSSAPMLPTRMSLSREVRDAMIKRLNQSLADAADLDSQTKQAHWNVQGPNFYQLHKLFDELADAAEAWGDLLAERVTALGGTALGTVRMAAQSSRLPEYPVEVQPDMAHVERLAERYAMFANNAREDIDVAASAGDVGTSDLYTEIVREADKLLYFLEAHLQV